jgi:uncharacterized membrane protein (UPF0127 family)
MKAVRVVNQTRGVDVASRGEVARSFWQRGIGLMGRRSLPTGYGMAIHTQGPIHMFFMRIPLDVCHVSREGRVLRVLHEIKPWRVGPYVRGSTWVLELPAGTARRTGIQEGDMLAIEDAAPAGEGG